jgi:pimeloyl-ACP methyl ester carboxylesterase
VRLDIYDFRQRRTNQKHTTPLVFIHGAFHAKWCWLENFVPYFEKLGYRCLAIDLRGHGESEGKDQLNKYTINDYVEDVQSVVESLGYRVVLIGHSLAGAVIARLIQKHQVSAAVLMAPASEQGGLGFFNRATKILGSKTMDEIAKSKNPFLLVKDPKMSKVLFFTEEMPDEDYKKYYKQLGNESYTAVSEISKPIIKGDPNPLRIPMLVIGANKDGCFTPEEIKLSSQKYGLTPVFFDCGHDLMLDRCWKNVAKIMNNWLVQQGF